LLADGSANAWQRIGKLYPNASAETKQEILQHIARTSDLRLALDYLLITVGDDPTPAQDDPMLAEAAALLENRWQKPEDLEYGRKTMLLQKTDKRQWLVANAMLAFLTGKGDDSPFFPQSAQFQAKLIDLHSSMTDPFIKGSIVDGMNALGSKDAALILAKGLAVTDDELEAVGRNRAAVEHTLGESAAK
jgi:hypothetical protein